VADKLPADRDRCREMKRHLIRMKDALDIVQTTLRDRRERGQSLTAETAHKLLEGSVSERAGSFSTRGN
jgi:hypothetical protein